MTRTDPFTLEIIQSSLQAIADEMFAAMKKTAMSPIIYEVLDMGTGITDGRGQLASSGAGIPAFIGVLDKAVMRILELNDAETMRPGDIFVTNDPFYGGVTHLNDVVLAMPVFADDRLVAWTANIAHWPDLSGMMPGGVSAEATEIFQEGIRLPAVKLFDAGQPIEPLMRVIEVNSRLSETLLGDLWAAVAAVRIGAKRLQALAGKYGVDTFETALDEFMEHGERVARRGLAELPHGRFELSEEQDSGETYNVVVEITEDKFVVDLRDNPAQDNGPNNCNRDGCMVSAQMMFKSLTDPYGPANAGSFRPIELLTTPGTVFDAEEPAAFSIYYEVEIRLFDLIWRCLAPELGGQLPAGHFASICGTFIGGTHPDTGKHFTIVEPQVGGWGGSKEGDGNSALFSGFHGETYNCPAEIAELRYGLYVNQLRLNDELGGEGKFRGGRGIVLDYEVRNDNCFVTAAYTRAHHTPWPLEGGRDGSGNAVEIIRADGTSERRSVVSNEIVNEGDVIRIRTANGAGYGDPAERSAEAVADDVANGLISAADAAEIYQYP
ncbi:hydantoinase B/oxoprolinase family protein [Corynebacterium sp. Marseille-P4321]|uniref:hydantoinase B/oxoprolinase family protein n=1 Tax=Corynebacterium sp. Marseille-P4321 TaxID=2736603 RepID=UPI00158E67AC|nr:hydantoinase B/oxoprolinase family protein [Corynebacterium sp. Marseille-P4321]